jgi:phosphoketolase
MKTKTNAKTLSPDLLRKLAACWRAVNSLSVGQLALPEQQ